jgi:hypothetical protein
MANTTERFWAKVDRNGPNGCWLWTAGRTASGGYGQFYASPDARTVRAHRFAYELFVGSVPDGMVLDHLCRVHECVNPAHLELVTRKENCRRGIKGVLTTHCPQGHPYDAANTYSRPATPTWRACKECRRESVRRNRRAV